MYDFADGEIFGNMKMMNDKREQFETILEQKMTKLVKKLEIMESHKHCSFQQIDGFFEELVLRARSRCAQLKAEFEQVEAKEKL